MGIRERYEQGVFCWVDLMTTDPEAAKRFYAELFGWDFVDIPVDNGSVYSMALKNQRNVAALFALPEMMQQQHIPPHWQSYINVTDIDGAVERCQQHGGTILNPVCDVMESGRMATVQDPTQAVVNLWEAKEHIGAELVNEVNTFCWSELQTRGSEKAAKFYQSVFGWDIEIDAKPPNYVTCRVKGHLNCGIFDMDKINLPAHIPSAWAVYFNIENLDTALETVKKFDGKTLIDPVVIEEGRFVAIADPQGAVLTIMEVNNPDD